MFPTRKLLLGYPFRTGDREYETAAKSTYRHPVVLHAIHRDNSIQRMAWSSGLGMILLAFSSQNLLTRVYNVWYNMAQMNHVQARIAELEKKRWTLAAIADELHVAHITVEKWKAGDRHTSLEKPVLDALDRLLTRKRIPKMRRYQKGSRGQRGKLDGTEKT